MKLVDFLELHGPKMKFLETTFLKDVFYEDFGERGLDLITPEVDIERNDGSGRKWRIDFVVQTKLAKYAIECDGFNYHAAGMVSRERFNDLESKRNETIRQGFVLISLSKDQIVDTPSEAIYQLRRTFNQDPELYGLFLRWNDGQILPHDVQRQALDALNSTRQHAKNSGLVVMATGLGKTYTAIFDTANLKSKRILFLVHVEQILKQAKNSFEKVMPGRLSEMGFYTGSQKDHLEKEIIFSTIQTMSREKNIRAFTQDYFDYVIIDEAHHTAAASYKIVTDYFQPKFLLGLTATPDRLDQKDILKFFGQNLVFEMGQEEAIRQGYLSKLRYLGFYDNVDYSRIHWNGFRYDVNDLNKLLMIKARDEAVIAKFLELAKDKKTIAFCVSIDHAEWSAEQFRLAGIDAIAIHSKIQGNSANGVYQSASDIIDAFERDEHQVVFVVDMLNEGIDIPDVECLLMLRPTQSSTIMTQQIGRGLRIAPGKQEVLVLDFIGNYKTAPTILKGLGIGTKDLEKSHDKDVYFYDNDGRTVEFDGKVIEIFKTFTSRASKEVDCSLITNEWRDYADYVSEMSKTGNNLYWSIGKKNNDLNMHRWAINLGIGEGRQFKTNSQLDEFLKNSWQENFPKAKTMEGIRALFFSKLIGFIESTFPFTASKAFLKFNAEYSSNFESAKKIASQQFEKFYFFTDIGSKVNRHSVDGEQRKVDQFFSLYPVYFTYEVLSRLMEYGFEKPYLTKFEIETFLVFAGKHSDLDEIAERIVAYRLYGNLAELEKLLSIKIQKQDTRFYRALSLIEYFSWSEEKIEVHSDLIEELQAKVAAFQTLNESGILIQYEPDDSNRYKEMLWSDIDLITYCQESSAQ